ncbi:MAG: zinc metalloprotease [Propionibacteriales bacterium]|nr:zinc metalloprotease [Propionibacteriales bacterium]
MKSGPNRLRHAATLASLGLLAFGITPASAQLPVAESSTPADQRLAEALCEPDGAESSARTVPGKDIAAHPKSVNHVSPARARRIEAAKRATLRRKGLTNATVGNVTIPVHFHVITDGRGNGQLTNRQLTRQIDVLNATFGGRESGAAAETSFSFRMASVQRIENPRWFTRANSQMMHRTHRGGMDELNIWTVGFGYLGIAQFPWSGSKSSDGIRVHWDSFPGGSIENFNLGKTATHEAGHWLGLYHTFQGGCAGKGDYVEDTPAMRQPTSGCPQGKDTCLAEGLDPIHNYMDYSHDDCYNQFTPGQSERMSDTWLAYRAGG